MHGLSTLDSFSFEEHVENGQTVSLKTQLQERDKSLSRIELYPSIRTYITLLGFTPSPSNSGK